MLGIRLWSALLIAVLIMASAESLRLINALLFPNLSGRFW